jgi:hypothetical protein
MNRCYARTALFAVLTLGAAWGCRKAEANFQDQILGDAKIQGYPVSAVECPTVALEDGTKFECTMKFEGGTQATAQAQVHGTGVEWQVQHVMVLSKTASKVESFMISKGRHPTSVTCGQNGQKVLTPKVGDTVSCTAVLDGKQVAVTVTVANEAGDVQVSYRVPQ